MRKFDVIVVGSGASGVNAAFPLVKAGAHVAMIDGGVFSNTPGNLSQSDFEDIRKNDADQYKIFLGHDLSGAISKNSHSLGMVSGPKKFITEKVAENLPTESNTENILQSLAKGGLSETWGGVCDFFTREELKACGLPLNLNKDYQAVVDRIGVSGFSDTFSLQRALNSDTHAQLILRKFKRKKSIFEKSKLSLYKPFLGVLSESIKGRQKNKYRDLDFWLDDGSVYRPHYTILELQKKENFKYLTGYLVRYIKELKSSTKLFCNKIDELNEYVEFDTSYVVLAAGAINTTRILLESMDIKNTKVPFLAKPHAITPALHLETIGKVGLRKKHSLCQLVIASYDSDLENRTYSQIYSYNSLLLSKVVPNISLPIKEAYTLLSLFAPSIVLVDTRFPVKIEGDSYMMLKKDKKRSTILINCPDFFGSSNKISVKIGKINSSIKKIGVLPLKTIFMPSGSTAHYAGGVPFRCEDKYPLMADSNGKLINSRRIYLGDASTWKYLPAKPPTLTIMAHANRVGTYLINLIKIKD